MCAGGGFGEYGWFGDDEVVSLHGVDGRRAGIVDVVRAFSGLPFCIARIGVFIVEDERCFFLLNLKISLGRDRGGYK